MKSVGWWTLVLIVGCGRAGTGSLDNDGRAASQDTGVTAISDAGFVSTDSGAQDAGFLACDALSEAACSRRPDCLTKRCPTCDGAAFVGCLAPENNFPCPRIACPGCVAFTVEPACAQVPNCAWKTCPDCGGLPPGGLCYDPRVLEPNCPEIACPPCHVLDVGLCVARNDCHAVFTGPAVCPCDAPGCCSEFVGCTDGNANCQEPPNICERLPPTCEGPYTIGYIDRCFEGCVLLEECGG